ncbi:MAG TPA: bifunctional ornithine acetyltransferase/N-acetylglutamate synthase, partial [Alphaproteobacteria bacterium]|nr:bifunctional ornithine acetyltransferase/N-acetylglutamate synthase [Alphaproteobacteria bacterium]
MAAKAKGKQKVKAAKKAAKALAAPVRKAKALPKPSAAKVAQKSAKPPVKPASVKPARPKAPVKAIPQAPAVSTPKPKAPLPVSPLAPAKFAQLPPLSGVRLGSGQAGIRYQGRTDVLLVVLSPGTTVGGALTVSKTASAPVEWCKANLAGGSGRVLVVNSGNANAFTGQAGRDAVRKTAESAAALVGCKPNEVFIASTGVIGEPLPADRLVAALPEV